MKTLKEQVKERLKEFEISPKRSLGQNFLINGGVISKIIATLDLSYPLTIEVGPGLGAITEDLKVENKFKLIELDRKLSAYWAREGYDVLEADALKVNWFELCENKKTQLVSNLPYQISSSLLVQLCSGPDNLDQMTLMYQKEVAERIASEPGSKQYGLLSVMAQVFWTIQFVLDAGPTDFYPRPNIASRVLKFTRKPLNTHDLDLEGRTRFLKFVKAAFQQRRKFLMKNVSNYIKGSESKRAQVLELFSQWGFDEKVRAERLSPQQFLDFYKVFNI